MHKNLNLFLLLRQNRPSLIKKLQNQKIKEIKKTCSKVYIYMKDIPLNNHKIKFKFAAILCFGSEIFCPFMHIFNFLKISLSTSKLVRTIGERQYWNLKT